MKAKTSTEVVVNLELSMVEASWLMGYLQNSFVEDEDPRDSEMRSKFFHALKAVITRNERDT